MFMVKMMEKNLIPKAMSKYIIGTKVEFHNKIDWNNWLRRLIGQEELETNGWQRMIEHCPHCKNEVRKPSPACNQQKFHV